MLRYKLKHHEQYHTSIQITTQLEFEITQEQWSKEMI